MSPRRLLLAVPLSLLVAVLMHVVLFGSRHAPGTDHAGQILTSLGVGLTLAALSVILCAALPARRGASLESCFASPLELLVGGAIAYALIELTEGHAPLVGGPWLITALVVSAFTVYGPARIAASILRRSGEALAAGKPRKSFSAVPLGVAFIRSSLHAYRDIVATSCRGRAPPLHS